MKVGIIGAGNVAQTLAKHILRAGNEVILSNSRGAESLKDLAAKLGSGAHAGSVQEAAKQEVVILAVWWDNIESALSGITDWDNRILIDTTNQLSAKGNKPHVVDTTPLTGSEVVAGYAKGARVIKAFNALYGQYMDGTTEKGKRVLFFAGDDAAAKKTVNGLFEAMGFYPVDLGGLREGGALMQVGGVLNATHFIQVEE